MTKAIALVTRRPIRNPAGGPKGHRPAPALPMAGASRPPGQALASVVLVEPVLPQAGSLRAGKGNAFPLPPETKDAIEGKGKVSLPT